MAKVAEVLGSAKPLLDHLKVLKAPIVAVRRGKPPFEDTVVVVEESLRSHHVFLVFVAEEEDQCVGRRRGALPLCSLLRSEVRDLVRRGRCLAAGRTMYIKVVDRPNRLSTIVNKKGTKHD
jgi:hypothetical protein